MSYVPTPSITGAAIFAAMEELRDVIAEVTVNGEPLGASVLTDGAGAADALSVVILPPTWEYGGAGIDLSPDSLVSEVYVIAPNTDMVALNLLSMAISVGNAIDANSNHACRSADLGAWTRGGKQYPAYVLSVGLSIQ